MPLRIAHFSDLHYADETLAEVERCFSHAVDQAISNLVEVAIITGDTTDHALNAHSPALVALARQIQRLADHCPVLMLQGTYSHEPPGFLSLFPLIRGNHPIWIAERLQQVALTKSGNWIGSDGWQFDSLPEDAQLLCTCLPTLNRATLAAAVGATDAAGAMGDQLTRILPGYAQGHRAARCAGIPVAVLSHGTVHGCVTEHGVPMAGADHEFTSGALFDAQATAVMLGHIHKHQAWVKDARSIAYAGSIGRLHYGEEGDKGFLIWTLDADYSHLELVPTPARRTHDIVFEGAPDIEALANYAATHVLTDTWLRIRWQVLEEERDQVDRERIRSMFSNAAGLKLEGRIVPISRARASGISRELSLARQIEHWAAITGIDAQAMIQCLEQSRLDVPEKIAERILQQPTEIEDSNPALNQPSAPLAAAVT